jgi:hypothetical protein
MRILRLIRDKVYEVAKFLVHGVLITLKRGAIAGALTLGAFAGGGCAYTWLQTHDWPTSLVWAGILSLAVIAASISSGVVMVLSLIGVLVGLFFCILGDPNDSAPRGGSPFGKPPLTLLSRTQKVHPMRPVKPLSDEESA